MDDAAKYAMRKSARRQGSKKITSARIPGSGEKGKDWAILVQGQIVETGLAKNEVPLWRYAINERLGK